MATCTIAKRVLWIAVLCLAAGCRRATPVPEPETLPTHTPGDTGSVVTVSVPTSTPGRGEGQTEPTPDATPTLKLTVVDPVGGQMSEEQAVALAKQEVARHLGSDKGPFAVVKAERVTWSDASLGCPRKGMMYAQVLTPGYQVILRVGDVEYDVHIGRNHAVICQE